MYVSTLLTQDQALPEGRGGWLDTRRIGRAWRGVLAWGGGGHRRRIRRDAALGKNGWLPAGVTGRGTRACAFR
jgi:hypothetical protein